MSEAAVSNDQEEEKKKEEKKQPARRSLRQSINKITTKELSRFHQLFWNTDDRNSQKRRLRKRKHEPSEQHLGRLLLKQVHDSPHVYVIDNFLTESELQHLHENVIAKSKFSKSFVDKDSTEALVDEEHRTSTFISLSKQADSKISAMERKVADLLGLSPSQVEPLQLVRYTQGQFFGVHHDLGNLAPDGSVELPQRQPYCKRRLATVFLYLNNLKEGNGGCTYFPACEDLRVQPKRGRAVLFCNLLRDGNADPLTIHAGEPVRGQDEIKYGLNIWACEA